VYTTTIKDEYKRAEMNELLACRTNLQVWINSFTCNTDHFNTVTRAIKLIQISSFE